MAPEQAAGDELTTVTDVYGLGAVLYALLTGRSPFRAKTVRETIRLVCHESPTPPSDLNPDVDKDLEAICLRCLSKDKEDRYGSAYALGEDLARYRVREETTALRWSRRERVIRWCQRNPVITGLLAAAVMVAVLTVVMALKVAEARRDAQVKEALESNSYAAGDLAKTALLQLQDWSDPTEAAAGDAELVGLLERNDRDGLGRYLERICGEQPSPFATCFILNRNGVIVARTRPEQEHLDDVTPESFAWRDYYQGAREHGSGAGRRSVHVSSVYRGRSDDFYKFAISVPIRKEEKLLGVMATSITADATIGLVDLDDPRREVTLIAPRDVDSPDRGIQLGRYVILFHPAYREGVDAIDFPDASPILRQLDRVHDRELDPADRLIQPDAAYVDPVGSILKDYEGRWIAGFAPVGHTGFAVIVQQRFETLKLDPSVFWYLILWSGVVSCLAVAIVGIILWQWARPSRDPNPS